MPGVADYASMRERIVRDLEPHVGRLTGDEVGLAIQDAIERLTYESFWWLDHISTGLTTVANQVSNALPTDFVSLEDVTMTVSGESYPLYSVTYDYYRWLQTDENDLVGQPFRYSLFQSKIWWYPTPDQAYTYTLYYRRRLTELSDDTDTNDWLTYGWQMLRWEVLAELGTSPLDLPEQIVGRWRALAERERGRLLSKSMGRMVLDSGRPRDF